MQEDELNFETAVTHRLESTRHAINSLRNDNNPEWEAIALFYAARYKIMLEIVKSNMATTYEAVRLKHNEIIQFVDNYFPNIYDDFQQLFKTANLIRYNPYYALDEPRYEKIKSAHANILKFDKTKASY